MRIVGLLLIIAGLMLGIGSNLPVFIDPPSVIIVLTFTVGALWLSGTSIPLMVRALSGGELSAGDRSAAAAGWELAGRASVAAGYVGVLVGAVIMLRHVDDIGAIGPGLAICILTALYGIVVGYGICLPCQRYVESAQSA